MRKVNSNILSKPANANQASAALDTNQIISISAQAVFSDNTAAGTLKLQMSNDVPPAQIGNEPAFAPTNWTDIPNQSATIASGAAAVLTIAQPCYRWIRATYTDSTSGASTATINVSQFALSI